MSLLSHIFTITSLGDQLVDPKFICTWLRVLFNLYSSVCTVCSCRLRAKPAKPARSGSVDDVSVLTVFTFYIGKCHIKSFLQYNVTPKGHCLITSVNIFATRLAGSLNNGQHGLILCLPKVFIKKDISLVRTNSQSHASSLLESTIAL